MRRRVDGDCPRADGPAWEERALLLRFGVGEPGAQENDIGRRQAARKPFVGPRLEDARMGD